MGVHDPSPIDIDEKRPDGPDDAIAFNGQMIRNISGEQERACGSAPRINRDQVVHQSTPQIAVDAVQKWRIKLLQGAFNVDRDAVGGKRVLHVDDLYRSGATATVVAQGLFEGGAAAVYMLAMTKTRTRT
jgi:predicted amidophosphoribosyltransferase